jgi:hypothetical protein
MTMHYQKLYPREGSGDHDSKDGNKIGLLAFNGVCFKCGKTSHKANNCNQKNANGMPNKFMAGGKSGNPHKNLQCHGCRKTGHITKNCWEKESNAHKQPTGWKSSKETGAVSADVGGNNQVEFLFCRLPMTFPGDSALLNDPNVWIGNTGATTHQTCHDIGLVNEKKASKNDASTMGNGTNETAAKQANLPGIVCNKEGQELGPVVMKDVTVLKHGKFNLFSIPKMLTQGWKLGGDREQIWIFKEDAHIDFDIKIPTLKGTLYVMYFKRNMETGLAVMSKGAKMDQQEIGIMPTLDENKMVQVGESKATQMTESLSESESIDDHSEAGERNGTNVHAEEVRENDGGAKEKNEDEDEAIKMMHFKPSRNQTNTFD